MKDTTVTFTDDEVKMVLKALSRLPFGDVYALIEKIIRAGHEQAGKGMSLGKPLAPDFVARSLSVKPKKAASKKNIRKSPAKKSAGKKK